MAAVGDKYLLFTTSFADNDDELANPLINVFAYEAASGTVSADDLNGAFQSLVLPSWVDCVNIHTVMRTIQVINLDDPVDFLIDNINETGVTNGEILPSFMAYEFEYVRAVRGVHSGRKSIAGLDEGQLSGGEASGTELGLLNILAADFGTSIAGTLGLYTPRIWRRQGTYKVDGVPTVFPHTFYPISGVVYRRVSTQNTRKR